MKRGEVIDDRFELQRIAGGGAMGVVWRALDRESGAPVAVKLLRFGAERERFARETRLLAELDHPGVVRYVAHGESEEGSYLVMEWLEGENLAVRLEKSELTPAESVAVVRAIASAIGAAHRRFIVHRDLKPSNVFLVGGSTTDVRVLDFGVARQGAFASELTGTGAIIGSPRYMAPEQARGASDVGPRADVWALGAILYRCLTGKPLVADGPIEAVLAELLLEPVPRVSDTRPDVPPELDELVARLLAKEPEDRLADGAEVASELASLRLPADVEAPRSVRAEHGPITLLEQRFTCVVVVHGVDEARSGALAEIASRHGGELRRRGDGHAVVLASHGTASDLVASAARCALEIRALAPDARLAVATGTGPVSDLSQPERTVVARAESLLTEERRDEAILIDRASVGLLEARFEIAPVEGESAFARLVAERIEPTPLRRLLGRPTPCVGRERELAAIGGLLAECVSEGVARVALLTGPAGIGKSRLRYELLRRVPQIAEQSTSPMPGVWLGRADPVAAGSPFGVLASALRNGLQVELGGRRGALSQALEARLLPRVPAGDVSRIAENVGVLLGVGAEPATSADRALFNPLRVGNQLLSAWEDLLTAELSERPLLLVLEDLQWGDWSSLRFVDAALRNLRDRPLMVLALARPEVLDLFPGLWSERGVVQLPLSELGKKASEKLVAAVLGERATPALTSAIAERAAGNAFFLEELIRAVAEEPEVSALPPSVIAMAQARLGTLEPEARQILRAASLFGQVFWQAGLEKLLEGAQKPRQIRELLGRLADRELISPRRSSRYAGEEELVFRHALVRDAAYGMLTEDDAARGHRVVARWLDSVGEREPLLMAEHWWLGGDRSRATPLYRKAAEQALEGNDFAAALAHSARALEGGAEGELAGEVHLIRSAAHQWRGEIVEREAAARRAMELFPRLSKRWYFAAAETARIASRLGRHDEMASLVDEIVANRATPTAAARALVLAQLGVPALRAGKQELAAKVLEALDAAEPDLDAGDAEALGWLARMRGYAALVAGDAAVYLRQTERAAAFFERALDARNALTFQTSVGFANIALGRYAEAERVLRAALERSERMNLALTVAIARHNLGFAVAARGRLEEGIAIERLAIADAVRQKDRWIECVSATYLADLLFRAGKYDEAKKTAERAIELSDRPNKALALALLARIEQRRGFLDTAKALSQEAITLLEELGGIEDGDAVVRLVRAEVLHAAGDTSEARLVLESAERRLRQRAAAITDPELAESFLENVAENAATLARAREWLPS